MSGLKAVTPAWQNKIFDRTKGSGAEVIRRKGGAGWAVGATVAEVVHAIILNKRQLLPVSSTQNGCYGIRGISLSVPTVVGKDGAEEHHEFELWPKEAQALSQSAAALKKTLAMVK
jgi:L-lactate dehydrogenase